jgi:hypothetical protein
MVRSSGNVEVAPLDGNPLDILSRKIEIEIGSPNRVSDMVPVSDLDLVLDVNMKVI